MIYSAKLVVDFKEDGWFGKIYFGNFFISSDKATYSVASEIMLSWKVILKGAPPVSKKELTW